MIRQAFTRFSTVLALAAVFALGCQPTQPFYFSEDGDLSHYKGVATDIDYPDLEVASLAEVEGALPPLTLDNSKPKEVWQLSLEDAHRYALENSKVMRSLGGQARIIGTESPTVIEQLLRSPEASETVYDPAIVESNPRQGVEGVLAAFDTQFSTSVFWEKNHQPRNVQKSFSALFPSVFEQDTGNFQAQLAKTAATGGQWFLRNNTLYDANNSPSNLFPSAWTTNIEAEFRQPLLQGAGVQFNRIANPGGVPGFYNGVMIARINTDVALADFEMGVRNLVSDVETGYWELYFAYRNLDTVVAGRDSALQTWRRIHALYVVGGKGGEAENEAQAREQYFLFRGQVEGALSALYASENRLRYVMGLAATDGRLIRPADEPTSAKVTFDWYEIHGEALTRAVEVRRQKWQVKRRELELIAAKNFLLPRLDAVGRYRWLGWGNDLINPEGHRPPFDNAFQTLTDGDFQEWQLGLQLSMPIGFRKEMAGVRNAQLELAKQRAILQDQELELSHALSDAVRQLDRHYVLSRTNFNRRVAAQRQVEAVQAALDAGTATLDLLLDAQRRLAEAESAYYRSLVDYNEAIADIHLRKGSLLEYNGVCLAEGPWAGKAYFDARRRARQRDASLYLNYGFTQPRVISRGPYQQRQDVSAAGFQQGAPTEAAPPTSGDALPTPTAPGQEMPGPATAPGGTPSTGEATPAAPAEPATPGPEATTPGSAETAPAATAPAETTPAETAPAATAPAETAPAETAPVEKTPGDVSEPTLPTPNARRPVRPNDPRLGASGRPSETFAWGTLGLKPVASNRAESTAATARAGWVSPVKTRGTVESAR
ncbi:MAG: TolC family protein [Pirellulales bacterium]